MSLDDLARTLYSAYCNAAPRGRSDGKPLLCWDALTNAQRRRWERVAGAAYDIVRQDVAEARRRVEARRRPAESPQR